MKKNLKQATQTEQKRAAGQKAKAKKPQAKVNIFTEGLTLPWNGVTKARLAAVCRAICGELCSEPASLTVILTTNEGIRAVNKQYRKKNKPTDVISFAYSEEPFPGEEKTAATELGDIYISLEKAAEQSSDYGLTLAEEIKRLLIHGTLHLLGYDHERSKEDAKIMQAEEERLFDAV